MTLDLHFQQWWNVPTGAERSRDEVVAGIQAKADASTGCRTVANGVPKCDLPGNVVRSDDTAATRLHAPTSVEKR